METIFSIWKRHGHWKLMFTKFACVFQQFIAMGSEQRNAIRKALNEDAEKLLQEGDPNDPQLRRLKREIDEVNRLFDEFERRASGEYSTLWVLLEEIQSQSHLRCTRGHSLVQYE